MKETEKHILFWNGIYSNWFYSPFTVGNVQYNCVEQFMMEQKARLFDDEVIADKIMSSDDPSIIKKLGKEVSNFVQKVWDKHKYSIVYTGCYAKFSQNSELKKEMLSTGNKTFVEASPYDRIWGIGLGENHPNADNPSKWRGENLLGKALTEVRDHLAVDA